MVINLNYFAKTGSNPLSILPAQQRRDINAMLLEIEQAREDYVKNFAGMQRITVEASPFITRKNGCLQK